MAAVPTEDTLGLIKPNAFGKRAEIQALIRKHRFQIVESFELKLSRADAEEFYAEHKSRPFFGELVEFMTSGKIVAMRLRREGAIAAWRLLMGPTNFETAKKEAPNSIRALYGESMTANASHGSDSTASAQREVGFFFGEGGVVARNCEETLALIKPNAFGKRVAIRGIIRDNGFVIADSCDLELSKTQAEAFYAEHSARPFFGELVDFMTSGRIVAMRLKKQDAIAEWRALMGPTNFESAKRDAPTSIRALYGESMTANASHGSDSKLSANRELSFFFGDDGVVSKFEDTLALIKPNAFAKRTEIQQRIRDSGFEIFESCELEISTAEAKGFYAEHKSRPFFGELVQFMTSGKIVAMRLRKVNAIADWRALMGPTNFETAKTEAPTSIRALYGESMTANASHGSDSTASAKRELAYFFDDNGVASKLEETLALIKPNAFAKKDEIQKIIREKGFEIAESYDLELATAEAQQFYDEHKSRPFFGELVEFMTCGKIVAMRLRKADAVADWRALMGPTNFEVAKTEAPSSLRALYGESMTANATHGSDSLVSAMRELDFFFGPTGVVSKFEDTLALIKPNAFERRDEILSIVESNGFEIVESCELQMTKANAEAFYAEHCGKGFFEELVEFMTSGEIVALRLRRENAIAEWRALMGPTNHVDAKEMAPMSIRALYGESMTANASHGSDSLVSAKRELELFFGIDGIAKANDDSDEWIDVSGDGGILKKILVEGSGGFPPNGANVYCHYVGTLTDDGTQFDSSRERDSPFNFPLGQGRVIQGWDKGIATMKRGEKCVLRCSAEYAYGDKATGNIPPGSSLDFEVELLSFDEFADLESGLKWKRTEVSTDVDAMTPNDFDTCTVSYTASLFDEDNEDVDGTVFAKGETIEFQIGDTEGFPLGFEKALQQLKKGDSADFILAPEMAFGSVGNAELNVPPFASVRYAITMHDVKEAPSKWDMDATQMLAESEKLKNEANALFKEGKLSRAMSRYTRCVEFLEEEGKFEAELRAAADSALIKVKGNIALIQFKQKEFSESLATATEVLALDAVNVKALVRRAQAHISLGNHSQAKRDLKRAKALDPKNAQIVKLQKINAKRMKAAKAKERELAKRMFARPSKGTRKKKAAADAKTQTEEAKTQTEAAE